jgi:hypothetical protein
MSLCCDHIGLALDICGLIQMKFFRLHALQGEDAATELPSQTAIEKWRTSSHSV